MTKLDKRHKWILTKKHERDGWVKEWWVCSSCGRKGVLFHVSLDFLNKVTREHFLPEMRKALQDVPLVGRVNIDKLLRSRSS